MSVTNVVLLLTLHTIAKLEHSESSNFKEVGSQLRPLTILTLNTVLYGFGSLFKS